MPVPFRTGWSCCWLVLLLLVVPIFFLSCDHQPRVETLEASVGTLTQPELIQQFGYPQRLKRLPPQNTEVWEYEFLAGDSRCVGYRIYFDEDQRSERWEKIACR
ncbi:MAG: hypothetical protein NNA18_09135 [Nitrospira sp.]|nr:hypothetical protein [Nitrospira sp.]